MVRSRLDAGERGLTGAMWHRPRQPAVGSLGHGNQGNQGIQAIHGATKAQRKEDR
jgi:hypothetical protein